MTQYNIPSMIKTASGLRVDPLNPRKENVKLNDVLAALGRQIRYNGHVDYSVRDHTLVMYKIFKTLYREPVEYIQQIPKDGQLGQISTAQVLRDLMGILILTHDMPEAYIGDMVQPLKQNMPEFKKVDDRILPIVMEAIIQNVISSIFVNDGMADRFTDMMRDGDAETWAGVIMRLYRGEGAVDFTNYLTHTLTLLDRNICDHLEMPCLHGNVDRFAQCLIMGGMEERIAFERILYYQIENFAQSTKATLIDKIATAGPTQMLDFVAARLSKPGRSGLAKISQENQFLHDFAMFDSELTEHVFSLLDAIRIARSFDPSLPGYVPETPKERVMVASMGLDMTFKTPGELVEQGVAELDAKIAEGLKTPLRPWSEAHPELLAKLAAWQEEQAREEAELGLDLIPEPGLRSVMRELKIPAWSILKQFESARADQASATTSQDVLATNATAAVTAPFSIDFDVIFEMKGGQWVGPKNPWGNNPDEKVLLDPDGSGEHRPDGLAIGQYIYHKLDEDIKFPMKWEVVDVGVETRSASVSLSMLVRASTNSDREHKTVAERVAKTFIYLRELLLQMAEQSQLTGSIYIAVRKTKPQLKRGDAIVKPESYQVGFMAGNITSQCPQPPFIFLKTQNWK